MDRGKIEDENEEVAVKPRMKRNKILHWPDRNKTQMDNPWGQEVHLCTFIPGA